MPVGPDPPVRLDDLQRVRGRHEDLRQERIGIQGDRRQHLVEFLLPERRDVVLCENRDRDGHQDDQEPDQCALPRAVEFHVYPSD